MTTDTFKELGLKKRTIGSRANDIPWEEPASWLDIPDLVNQDRFVGLAAINEHSTFFAFVVITSPGIDEVSSGFSVDWGNGDIINYASGDTVEYLYEFATAGNYNGLHNYVC